MVVDFFGLLFTGTTGTDVILAWLIGSMGFGLIAGGLGVVLGSVVN